VTTFFPSLHRTAQSSTNRCSQQVQSSVHNTLLVKSSYELIKHACVLGIQDQGRVGIRVDIASRASRQLKILLTPANSDESSQPGSSSSRSLQCCMCPSSVACCTGPSTGSFAGDIGIVGPKNTSTRDHDAITSGHEIHVLTEVVPNGHNRLLHQVNCQLFCDQMEGPASHSR
jgi:hypothetical protein